MKIVCDSCGAKYSIADEKVAGKVFKIRCKKCSAVIVVRGDQVGNQDAAAQEPAQPQAQPQIPVDAIWHVVIDGEQQGPYAMSQIGDMLSDGSIDWDSYVWREGFEGWLAARDVPELVQGLTGGGGHEAAQEAHAAAPSAAAAHDPYGGGAAAGLSPFQAGGGAAETGGGLFGTESAGADLFAQSNAGASPFDGGAADDVIASSPPAAAAATADQAMTGQRNENSVLFSLANLQALATGPEAGAPQASAPSPSASPAGRATGEGSGLIDIRALASTTGPTGPVSSHPPGGSKDKVDDLLSIGTGSAFGSSLGAPVLAPVQEEKSNRMVIIGAAAVVGVSVLAAAAVVAVVALREPPEVVAANQPAAITPPAGSGAALTTGQPSSDQAEPDGDSAAAGSDNTDSAGSEAPSAPRAATREATRRERERRARGSRSQPARSATPAAAAPMREAAPAPTPSMAASRRGGDDIDSLLAAALGGGGRSSSRMAQTPSRMASSGGGNLPETPPRDAVLRGLRSVSGPVRACGGGQHGVANTTVVIAGSSGRVQSARVAGSFAGTPVGSCVARAVRGARFPRFSRSTFSVTFPYSI